MFGFKTLSDLVHLDQTTNNQIGSKGHVARFWILKL